MINEVPTGSTQYIWSRQNAQTLLTWSLAFVFQDLWLRILRPSQSWFAAGVCELFVSTFLAVRVDSATDLQGGLTVGKDTHTNLVQLQSEKNETR